MENKRLAIIMASHDSYRDVFDIFMELFNENWPDCPYELVLGYNELPSDNTRVKSVLGGKDSMWSFRIKKAIECVDADYYMIIDEDMMITRKVITSEIEDVLNVMESNGIKHYSYFKAFKQKGKNIDNHDYLSYVKKSQPYGLALMSIMSAPFLKETIGNGTVEGWEIERKWLKEAYLANDEYFDDVIVDNRNIFNLIHGISKGCWFPSVLRKMKKLGYNIDIKQRKVLSNAEEIKIRSYILFGTKISGRNRVMIKNGLRKLGFKFISDY